VAHSRLRILKRGAAAGGASAGARGASARRGRLALVLQEAITAVVRLRAGRAQAPDADAFRERLEQLLAGAEQRALESGYAPEDVKLALYAVIVFLDESVLTSSDPMFAGWARRPLQEEFFGGHIGGEVFFDQLQTLLRRPDDEDTADVLEVFHLCVLLGFMGRYGVANPNELRGIRSAAGEKIRRVRGGGGGAPLAPAWRPPQEAVAAAGDPWTPPLAAAAATLALLAVLLWGFGWTSLRSAAGEVHARAEQLER